MNQQQTYNRRHFLCSGAALAGAGLLQACGNNSKTTVKTDSTSSVKAPRPVYGDQNLLRVFASSGFGEHSERSNLALQRLTEAGFLVTNQEACLRRSQRFAGSDAERAADLQAVANGQVKTPKVLMGLRGGYGAIRLLPLVNWDKLGGRMREKGTLLFGYSDVTAVQLALLAKGKMCSFAGPMLYSEFGAAQPSIYTMQSFVNNSTDGHIVVNVSDIQSRVVAAEGMMWGGNLSTLASLAGSTYLPDIKDGILFIEDVGEQPYRIERMLQTLYLNGILQRQQAIIMGQFRMGAIHDVYDRNYTLGSVIQTLSRLAKVPVLTGFPFGHVANKITFPLGAMAQIRGTTEGGYQVSFSAYPTLDKTVLSLDNLLPAPPQAEDPLAGFMGGEESQAASDAVAMP
ncbi:LD-carboxypeptidase [Neisseriaceae bacterium ESL0693]|nr:LD-carboxypeptidase [Neisseriaceae bacterium ESL0693]